jgi:acyl-ACP thioesterase
VRSNADLAAAGSGRLHSRFVLDEALVPMPSTGRLFRSRRRVGLADADVDGRLRLDGCARFLQDVAGEDATDSGLDAAGITWVVRRSVIDVAAPFRFGDWVDLVTWCSGTGARWAARRTSVSGGSGGSVEAESLWICLDVATQAPARLPAGFDALFGPSAGGRRISSRLWLDGPSAGATTVAWPLRLTDHDLLAHVNNAAYFEAVEEQLAGRRELLDAPHRVVIEYGGGIDMDASVELAVEAGPQTLTVWFLVDGDVQATVLVKALAQPGLLSP